MKNVPLVMGVVRQLLACGGVVAFSCAARADALDTWEIRSPLPAMQTVQSLSFLNGEFVAAAGVDGVLVSSDGINWRPASGKDEALRTVLIRDIAYGGGQYVAVGRSGAVFTSPDLVEWTGRWSGVTSELRSVAYGGGRFVAVGDQGQQRVIVTSTDGVQWSVARLSSEGALGKVVFAGRTFYAVGQGGVYMSSSDGLVWESHITPKAATLTSIAAGSNGFVLVGASGQLLNYANRVLITNSTTVTTTLPIAAYGNGRYLVIDGPRALVSSDGTNWTVTSQSGLAVSKLAFGYGLFVGLGAAGYVATSSDGVNWKFLERGRALFFSGAVGGPGTVLALGENTVLATRDGRSWTKSGFDPNYNAWAGAFLNNRWFFSGQARITGEVVLFSSTNASTWELISPARSPIPNLMAYGNGTYVGFGQERFMTSTDARTWIFNGPQLVSGPRALAYGDGRFVAVGSESNYVSSDGIRWSRFERGTNIFNGLVFGNGKFVAIGSAYVSQLDGPGYVHHGKIFTSTDGGAWQTEVGPFSPRESPILYSITFSHGWFVAVGQNGVILTSRDARSWALRESPTLRTLMFATESEGTFYAMGDGGLTMVSGNVRAARLAVRPLPQEGLRLELQSEPGEIFRVEETTALRQDWTAFVNVTNQSGKMEVLDPRPIAPMRFYRAVSE